MEQKVRPPFPNFHGNVSLWFAQMDIYFGAHSVPVTERLNILYCGLPSTLADSVSDLISDPSPEATYESVKSEIVRRNSTSSQTAFRQLMEDEDMGDRSPTQFLRRLRQLNGDSDSNEGFLRKLFIDRLPALVTTILAPSLETNTLDQIATMGDKIMDFSNGGSSSSPTPKSLIASASKRDTSSKDELSRKLDILTEKLNTLWSNRSRSRTPSRRRRDSFRTFRSRDNSSPGLCWYHKRFLDKAHKCIQPCSYSSKSEN